MILVSLALSMDAFAASVCLGMSVERLTVRRVTASAALFGAFQALMPAIGYALGASFSALCASFDHWIAFFLLGGVGVSMIWDALEETDEGERMPGINTSELIVTAFASSIDALAVGVTLAVSGEGEICAQALLTGLVTFSLSALGMCAGQALGERFRRRAEIAGGAVLAAIGAKILLEHLNLFGRGA